MQIDVERDRVVVEGQTIHRPAYIPRSEWYQLWESVDKPQHIRMEGAFCPVCDTTLYIG